MSSFYTSVGRYGNNLLYRGYNQAGKRIKKREWFKPTLFKSTTEESDWHSFSGEPVRPVSFDSMRDAKNYVDTYKDVDGFDVFGMQNYIFQFLNNRFPGKIKFNSSFINVNTIDIEVKSDDGFPDPDDAEKEILSIAMYSTFDRAWRIFGLVDYDSSKSYMREKYPDANIVYIKCRDEIDLIERFLDRWSDDDYCPDVVTGWYVRFFDIPYLVNRITKLLGEEQTKRLSPWGMVSQRTIHKMGGRVNITFDLGGIQTLDYQDLFLKFGHSYGPQESYKLDHIAYVVLDERKLSYEEYGNLNKLYEENPQLFIDYNLKDIDLVKRIDEVMGLLDLVYTMAYKAGVNYTDTLGTTAIWDSIIHRELYQKKIAIPPNQDRFKSKYPGGYVKIPQVGMHDWVVSFDLDSLYPNIIVQYNMSPETTLLLYL